MDNNILFCGTMVPEEIEYQVKDISAAGNRFQNNMIKNIERAGYKVVSCSFLGMHIPPKIKEKLCGNYIYKDNRMWKGIWKFHGLLRRTMSDTKTVMCYNIAYAWLLLPIMAKRKHIHSIVIAADYSESISYRSLSGKLYAGLQLWSMRRFDMVVGLSENMRGKLRKKQQFILMEGGIDGALYDSFVYKPHEKGGPVTFMYAGLLNHVAGVDILLEAIQQVKRQDIRLLISGKGELESVVKRAEKEDARICYLGHLPYDKYIQKLQEADVLVNPRNMDLPENQNNFPSKIMDYLATGKPIISTKFAGWKKFEENIFFCENGPEGIRRCLEGILDRPVDENAVFLLNREQAAAFRWEEQLKRILQ